ncbi:MAG: NUDIX hydrolase [Ignavibacteriales bacterium]|nr:MAG: NUDIX hydrolase [Ignavibacteriales bacterium]
MYYSLLKSEIVFKGKVFDVQVDEIEYESGNNAKREVALHYGGAVVVAITPQNKIVMVNQFRYPFKKYMIELPAGKLNKNENPEHCAIRELEEETGYTAKSINKLGVIATTPGFCSELLHIFLAEDLTAGEHNREEGEAGMEVFEYSFEEIEMKIRTGELYDSKSITGIFLAQLYLKNRNK